MQTDINMNSLNGEKQEQWSMLTKYCKCLKTKAKLQRITQYKKGQQELQFTSILDETPPTLYSTVHLTNTLHHCHYLRS